MKKNNKGFSLVELIIVIAIMAILAGAIAPALIRYIDKSRKSNDVSSCDSIETAFNTALGNESILEVLTTSKIVAGADAGNGVLITLHPAKTIGTVWSAGDAGMTVQGATTPSAGTSNTDWTSSSGKSEVECLNILYQEISDSLSSKVPKIKYKKDAKSKNKTDLSFYVYISPKGSVEVYIGEDGVTLANLGTYDAAAKILDGDAFGGNNVYEICPEVCDNYQ